MCAERAARESHSRSLQRQGWLVTIRLQPPDAASHFPFDDMTDRTLSSSQRGQDVTGRGASEGDRETGGGVGGRGEAEKAFGNMDLQRGKCGRDA